MFDLLESLQRASGEGRHQVYARCIPLLSEVDALNKPPLPVREVKSLMHEASWHLRSLAGLTMSGTQENEAEHAAWALASLEGLSGCAKACEGAA